MPAYEVLLTATFTASHHVLMPDGGRETPHSHAWRVEVELRGDRLDDAGMLVDFTIIQPTLRQITDELDGTLLNELPGLANSEPTTEIIARYIHDMLAPAVPPIAMLTKVRVWETADCAAAYVPDHPGRGGQS